MIIIVPKKLKNDDYNKKSLKHFAVGMISDDCNKKPLVA
jgi:hypothetical protein